MASVTETLTTSGTWTCPPGVTGIQVECWGGGGAGGGATGNVAAGGGGAGGSYAKKNTYTVVPGTAYTYTVGGTKTGNTTNTQAQNTGDPSWFSSNDSSGVAAQGGLGGNPATSPSTVGALASGSTATTYGDTVYAGGNGAAGILVTGSGGGGGGAGTTGAGGNGAAPTAGTGTSTGGGNGGAGTASNAVGSAGSTYGGGGGGGNATGVTDRAGGNGAAGRVILTYTGPLASDIFTGTNGDAFSSKWTTGLTPTGGTCTIQSNRGRFKNGTNAGTYQGSNRISRKVNITAPVDAVALFSFYWNGTPKNYPQFWIRSSNTTLDTENGYYVEFNPDANTYAMGKSVAYSRSTLPAGTGADDVAKTWATQTKYWCRFGIVGDAIKMRVWTDGASEPTTWDKTATDTAFTTAGSGCGFSISAGGTSGGAETVDIDDFSVDTAWPLAIIEGSAALSATTTVATDGLVTQQASAALSATTSIAAAGLVTELGSGPLVVSSYITADGLVTQQADVALTATTTLDCVGQTDALGEAALSATTSIEAGGLTTQLATAALSVSASLVAAGDVTTVTVTGDAALAASAILTADGLVTQQASAALSATTSLSTAGLVTELGTAALSATTSIVSATLVTVRSGAPTLGVTTTLAATGRVTKIAQASLTATTTLTTRGLTWQRVSSTATSLTRGGTGATQRRSATIS